MTQGTKKGKTTNNDGMKYSSFDKRFSKLLQDLKNEMVDVNGEPSLLNHGSCFTSKTEQISVNLENTHCPFIRTSWDSSISYDFPSEGNLCYKAKQPLPVSLSGQEHQCFTQNYQLCTTYLSVKSNNKFLEFIQRLRTKR